MTDSQKTKTSPIMPLNARQKKFAQLLVDGHTQAESYRQAGYKVKNDACAQVGGSHLVRNPKVKEYMDQLQSEVLEELHRRIVNASRSALITLEELAENSRDPKVRLQAAQDLMDRAGLAQEKEIKMKADSTNTLTITHTYPVEVEPDVDDLEPVRDMDGKLEIVHNHHDGE